MQYCNPCTCQGLIETSVFQKPIAEQAVSKQVVISCGFAYHMMASLLCAIKF